MKLRKILLTAMLTLLGLAAAGGAVAALFVHEQIASKLIATGVITVVTAGAFFALSFLLNREKTRIGGLLAMSIVVLECLAAFWLIWMPMRLYRNDDEAEAMGMVALAIYGAPATLFLLFGGPWKTSSATRIAVSSFAAAFGIALCSTLFGYRAFQLKWDLWQVALVVAAYGAVAALAVVRVPTAHWKWRWVGIVCALGATVLNVLSILGRDYYYVAGQIITGGAAVFVAYANLSLLAALRPAQLWLRRLAIGTALLTVLLLDGPPVFLFLDGRPFWLRDFCGRAAGATGVLAACGGLAMVVLGRLNRRDDAAEPEQKLITSVALTCPHCQTKQTIATGDSSCRHCGLRFHLEITEPRCPGCGYLLFMLQASRCPECGIELANAVQAPAPISALTS